MLDDEHDIAPEDNIFLPIIVDCEWTQFAGKPNDWTLEKLAKNENKFLLQKENIDSVLKKYGFEDCLSLALKQNLPVYELDNLEGIKSVKLKKNTHLTTQFKHVFYDDETILINPEVKSVYEKHVTDKKLHYPSYDATNGCHIIDYMKIQGFDIFLTRKPDIDEDDFKKKYKRAFTVKLYAYWLNADFSKIFHGQYLVDLKQAYVDGKITLNRRLIGRGHTARWYPNWLITINGEVYKFQIEFQDMGALQGNIGFDTVLTNLDMNTEKKKLLDGLKSNMGYALLKYPQEFQEYALNDLIVYEMYKKHNEMIEKVYIEMGLKNFICESRLTTGAMVNELQEAVLLRYLGYNERSVEGREELKSLTSLASPKHLKEYVDMATKLKNTGYLRRDRLAKVAGGRCYNNRQLILATSEYNALCDIDISSAYTTVASVLDYYFGNPVMLSFRENKVTLREFLKHYQKKWLVKRGFKLIVDTKKEYKKRSTIFTSKPEDWLEYEQDFLVSYPEIKFEQKLNKDDETITSVNLKDMPTAIYTRELTNTPICWDELDIILNGMDSKQRNDILDKAYMVTAVFYPKNFQCETIDELINMRLKNKIDDEGNFTDIMKHAKIENENDDPHYWHSTNFGKLIMNDIIQYRRKNKKSNPSLAYLFKLIGNTVYGNNVSQYFEVSNIILASNITAMCRSGMWCSEKALNISQTITDGGVFDMNAVLHKIRETLDTPLLVRAYKQDSRKMSKDKKWCFKPFTKSEKQITYKENIGYTLEGKEYPLNKAKIQKLQKELLKIVDEKGRNHQESKSIKEELDKDLEGYNNLLKEINELSLKHIQKTFSKVDLFNGKFIKYKKDENGIAVRDKQDNYIFEEVKGLFEFEVKNLCSYSVFHGSADYLYENPMGEETIKMRGYESKKDIISWYIDEQGRPQPDLEHYQKQSPINMFLSDLKNNPESVTIPRPYIKNTILKPKEYKNNYRNTWQHTNILPGYDYYKPVTIPIHSLRYKFVCYEQQKNWQSCVQSLKNKNGGLSFEIYYLNQDGTINYKKMIKEIDEHIAKGVMYPQEIYDKHNDFRRDLKLKKNQTKLKTLSNHIRLVDALKNLCRIILVGPSQYIKENSKIDDETGIAVIATKPDYYASEHYLGFEDANKYSREEEFEDYNLRFEL